MADDKDKNKVVSLFPENSAPVSDAGPVRRAIAALYMANSELARAAITEESREAYAAFEAIADALKEFDK